MAEDTMEGAGSGPVAGGGMMEDEEMAAQGMMMPQAIGISALTVTGDFLLFVGLLFMMLGIAAYVTNMMGIKGSGELLVGLALIVIAAVLLVRSRDQMKKMALMQQRMRQSQMAKVSKPKKSEPMDSYR